jgi:hypothetical protein
MRQKFKTKYLRDIVRPIPLKEALRNLRIQGEIAWYTIGRYNTTICLTKYSGLDMMIKEASQPVAITRHNIKNKTNERTLRKIKG